MSLLKELVLVLLGFFSSPVPLEHGYLYVDSGQHVIHIILKIVFINRYSSAGSGSVFFPCGPYFSVICQVLLSDLTLHHTFI